MNGFEQLNIYGLVNLKSNKAQHIHLFVHEEMKAELVILPPGTVEEWHSHAQSDELLDVVTGEGTFLVEEKVFSGGPGKSVLVQAGVRHMLRNDGDEPWIMRITYHERLYPRDFSKIIVRTIRNRLGIA